MQNYKPSAKVFVVVVAAFAYGALTYLLLPLLLNNKTRATGASTPGLEAALALMSALAFAASVIFMKYRLQAVADASGADEATDRKFMTSALIALALAESGAVFGLMAFFMCGSSTHSMAAPLVAIAIMLGYILPAGLGYWRGRS